jgi:hypothetical protein
MRDVEVAAGQERTQVPRPAQVDVPACAEHVGGLFVEAVRVADPDRRQDRALAAAFVNVPLTRT